MAKSKTKKKSAFNPAQVPCLRVVIGANKGSTGKSDPKGCLIVGENRNKVTKSWDIGKQYRATNSNVKIQRGESCGTKEIKKGKHKGKIVEKHCGHPCKEKRKGCPVQLAFEDGQPFMRFCRKPGDKQPGYRVDVDSTAEAVSVSKAACASWKENGGSFEKYFPEGTKLRGR